MKTIAEKLSKNETIALISRGGGGSPMSYGNRRFWNREDRKRLPFLTLFLCLSCVYITVKNHNCQAVYAIFQNKKILSGNKYLQRIMFNNK
jgi:hypothetical protein